MRQMEEKAYPSGNVVILNGSLHSGMTSFFNAKVLELYGRVDLLILLCTQHNPKKFCKLLLDTFGSAMKCVIFDAYSDPLEWYKGRKATETNEAEVSCVKINIQDNIAIVIENEIKKMSSSDDLLARDLVVVGVMPFLKKGHKKVGIAIDGLASLIRHQGSARICHLLNKFNHWCLNGGVTIEDVLVAVNRDVHSSDILESINHYASKIVWLLDEGKSSKGVGTVHNTICCDTIIKKKSGKVTRERVSYVIRPRWELEKNTVKDTTTSKVKFQEQTVDPTSNIPFRLELSEAEKEARSQVNLPYTYNEERKNEHLNRSVGEGKVFYQPDEVDDFDEEDPDDDLNI